MLLNLKSNFYIIKKFRSSLFFRLSILIIVFTLALVFALVWGFWFSFERQDSILDAHEAYFYSNMVEDWGLPPDTLRVKKDIENLHLSCAIYHVDNDYSREDGTNKNSPKYWASSIDFPRSIRYGTATTLCFLAYFFHKCRLRVDRRFVQHVGYS